MIGDVPRGLGWAVRFCASILEISLVAEVLLREEVNRNGGTDDARPDFDYGLFPITNTTCGFFGLESSQHL